MLLKDKHLYAENVAQCLTHSKERYKKHKVHGEQVVMFFETKEGEKTYTFDCELFVHYLHATPEEVADYIENFLMFFE